MLFLQTMSIIECTAIASSMPGIDHVFFAALEDFEKPEASKSIPKHDGSQPQPCRDAHRYIGSEIQGR
jgi:hypothetical protein